MRYPIPRAAIAVIRPSCPPPKIPIVAPGKIGLAFVEPVLTRRPHPQPYLRSPALEPHPVAPPATLSASPAALHPWSQASQSPADRHSRLQQPQSPASPRGSPSASARYSAANPSLAAPSQEWAHPAPEPRSSLPTFPADAPRRQLRQ